MLIISFPKEPNELNIYLLTYVGAGRVARTRRISEGLYEAMGIRGTKRRPTNISPHAHILIVCSIFAYIEIDNARF